MNRNDRGIRLGIDFGGVIVQAHSHEAGEDTSLTADDRGNVAHEGVFEAIRELVEICEKRVWIVSKAGPRMQSRTRAWLKAVDFHARTELPAANIRFCLERDQKAGICQELEISHFVDDRIQVMQFLRHTVPHLFLFGERDDERFCPPWVTFVCRWSQIVELLRPRV